MSRGSTSCTIKVGRRGSAPGGRRPEGCSTRNQDIWDCSGVEVRTYGATIAAMYGSSTAPPSSLASSLPSPNHEREQQDHTSSRHQPTK